MSGHFVSILVQDIALALGITDEMKQFTSPDFSGTMWHPLSRFEQQEHPLEVLRADPDPANPCCRPMCMRLKNSPTSMAELEGVP